MNNVSGFNNISKSEVIIGPGTFNLETISNKINIISQLAITDIKINYINNDVINCYIEIYVDNELIDTININDTEISNVPKTINKRYNFKKYANKQLYCIIKPDNQITLSITICQSGRLYA